jgi:hypothetical protein
MYIYMCVCVRVSVREYKRKKAELEPVLSSTFFFRQFALSSLCSLGRDLASWSILRLTYARTILRRNRPVVVDFYATVSAPIFLSRMFLFV